MRPHPVTYRLKDRVSAQLAFPVVHIGSMKNSWISDGIIDHTAIQASCGHDSSNGAYYGSVVDYHTHNMYYIIWTMASQKPSYDQEAIYPEHIQ